LVLLDCWILGFGFCWTVGFYDLVLLDCWTLGFGFVGLLDFRIWFCWIVGFCTWFFGSGPGLVFRTFEFGFSKD
jgi:hypothetical protein